MTQLKLINQQVVVVVGASSGIGRETALKFAQRGAKVVVSARNEQGLESLIQEIRGEGGEATAISADVSDFAQVQANCRPGNSSIRTDRQLGTLCSGRSLRHL